jgi:hypothetical protein
MWGVKTQNPRDSFYELKVEKLQSTFDDEWDLRWNFNVKINWVWDGINSLLGYRLLILV